VTKILAHIWSLPRIQSRPVIRRHGKADPAGEAAAVAEDIRAVVVAELVVELEEVELEEAEPEAGVRAAQAALVVRAVVAKEAERVAEVARQKEARRTPMAIQTTHRRARLCPRSHRRLRRTNR
jgi:hypothetical protein